MHKVTFVLIPGITNIPLWTTSKTTMRDLLLRAAELQVPTQTGMNLNHVLGDPDYQPLLDQGVFQSGLLQGNLLNLFNPARWLLVIISFAGNVYRFQMPASATVRDAKQKLKGQLPSELRKNVPFELLITGSFDRAEGNTSLLTLVRLPYQNVCFDLVPRQLVQIKTPRLLSVNERVFRRHLQQNRFQAGVDRGL